MPLQKEFEKGFNSENWELSTRFAKVSLESLPVYLPFWSDSREKCSAAPPPPLLLYCAVAAAAPFGGGDGGAIFQDAAAAFGGAATRSTPPPPPTLSLAAAGGGHAQLESLLPSFLPSEQKSPVRKTAYAAEPMMQILAGFLCDAAFLLLLFER